MRQNRSAGAIQLPAVRLNGSIDQRFVHYPIGPVDPETGWQRQNWIAELTFDPSEGWEPASWNQTVDPEVFLPAFAAWDFDWLDIPALVGRAEQVWEYPMVDRDPAPTWSDGRMYEGEWKNNLMHGRGKFTWPDGTCYSGEYLNDQKHGFGVFTWETGKRYEGHWTDGVQHGLWQG